MSFYYPRYHVVAFFQVVQGENVVSGFQNCAGRYDIYDHYNVPCLGELLEVLCFLKVFYFMFPIGLTFCRRIPSSTAKNYASKMQIYI